MTHQTCLEHDGGYKLCFWASLGLGTFSIGFLVSNYVYFIIRTTIQDPLGSIYDEKTKILIFFYIDSLNLTFLGLWDPHRTTERKKLV